MIQTEKLFLRLLKRSLFPQFNLENNDISTEEISSFLPEIAKLAKKHNVFPPVYHALCELSIPFSDEMHGEYANETLRYCISSYERLAFFRKVHRLLSEIQVRYYVLKGPSLLPCYTEPVFRKYNDIDIYIPDDNEFEKAKNYLLQSGFIPSSHGADHHQELYDGQTKQHFLLELHSKIIATQDAATLNALVEKEFSKSFPAFFVTLTGLQDITFPTFPVTQNAFYLLLHMLEHFLDTGFGIRQLADWALFLTKYGTQIKKETFLSYLHQSHLSSFASIVTTLAKEYFYIPEECTFLITKTFKEEYKEQFLQDILSAGEFGKADNNRMAIVAGSASRQSPFHLLHKHTVKRFPKLSRTIILLPVLWIIAGICFLYNNRFLRKTSSTAILTTNRKRQKLISQLNLPK